MRKTTILAAFIGVLVSVGGCIYFAAGVSSTFPPIKKYRCSANVDQLVMGLKKYVSGNTNTIVSVTDTVGNSANDQALYLSIKMTNGRHQLEYNLKCENEDTRTSKVSLVFAYDAATLTGGYGDEARGVGTIIKYFDENFLVAFQKSQSIKLTTIKPSLLDPLKHLWNGD